MENNENIKENVETSNRVHMIGTVVGGLIADHEYYGEAYYRFLVRTKRTSGVEDTVPCLISITCATLSRSSMARSLILTGSSAPTITGIRKKKEGSCS